MSRVGNKIISIPDGVSFDNKESHLMVKGPNGNLVVTMLSLKAIDLSFSLAFLMILYLIYQKELRQLLRKIRWKLKALINNLLVKLLLKLDRLESLNLTKEKVLDIKMSMSVQNKVKQLGVEIR